MASPLTQLQEAWQRDLDGRENSLQGPSSCESRVHVISGVFLIESDVFFVFDIEKATTKQLRHLSDFIFNYHSVPC